jgi:predicted nucleic acid-binding protein
MEPARALHVDARRERVVLDEVAARLDQLAHQLGEDVVGVVDVLHLQGTGGGVRSAQ